MQLTDLPSWIETEKADIEATLRALVEINTFTSNTAGVDEGMDLITRKAEEMGLTVETVNVRHRLIKAGNGKGPRVLLIAHMDTVHPPDSDFKHYTDLGDGFITGPGVGDIKGGLVMALWTVKAISSILTDYDLQLIVSADEEKGSPTIKDWYGDRNAHGADYAIGMEPGFPQGPLTPTVDLGVVYERRGYCAITFTVHGKSSHSGTPELGLSAIDAMARKIVKMNELNDWDNGISVNVGLLQGGSAANTVAAEAQATVSFRYRTLQDGINTREAIERIIQEPTIHSDSLNISDTSTYNVDTYLAPMERTEQSQKLVDIVMEEAQTLGHPVVPIARGGGSDANHISGSGVPSICGMGAPSEGIHTKQEKIYLPMMFERINLLTRTVYRVLTEKP